MAVPTSSLPVNLTSILKVSDVAPNSGAFQSVEQIQDIVKKTAYSQISSKQDQEIYTKSLANAENISRTINGKPLRVAMVASGIIGGVVNGCNNPASVADAVVKVIKGSTTLSASTLIGITLTTRAVVLVSIPLIDFFRNWFWQLQIVNSRYEVET